jgi:hypothetical protein
MKCFVSIWSCILKKLVYACLLRRLTFMIPEYPLLFHYMVNIHYSSQLLDSAWFYLCMFAQKVDLHNHWIAIAVSLLGKRPVHQVPHLYLCVFLLWRVSLCVCSESSSAHLQSHHICFTVTLWWYYLSTILQQREDRQAGWSGWPWSSFCSFSDIFNCSIPVAMFSACRVQAGN